MAVDQVEVRVAANLSAHPEVVWVWEEEWAPVQALEEVECVNNFIIIITNVYYHCSVNFLS